MTGAYNIEETESEALPLAFLKMQANKEILRLLDPR